jgi:hypothetical protein
MKLIAMKGCILLWAWLPPLLAAMAAAIPVKLLGVL